MKYLFIMLVLVFPCLSNGQGSTQSSLCLPSITTDAATSVGLDSALIGGNITNDGGSSIVLRGVCYSTSPNPNMGNSRTEDGSGIGSFITVLRGLTSSTTYYARSYAKNSNGVVVYGNEVSFTTSATAPSFTCGTSTVTDVDNNTYNTVQIGTQCWTQSNLKVSKYRNGDNIPTGLSISSWQNTTSGAYAIYNNDPVNDGLYGKLYNHYAVTDSRGLCPTGWYVPSVGEWTTLENHLGGRSGAGALKSTATQPTAGGWNSPNTGATNSSGFTALPGGIRDEHGNFIAISSVGSWWSSTFLSWNVVMFFSVFSHQSESFIYDDRTRSSGTSVRCLKDSASGGGLAALPTVTTTSATGITSIGATTGGNVTADGGASVTARGVAYGTVQNPTTANSTTSDGTGTGVFTSTLTGLTASTLYYVRAYATNSVGTAYGNEVSFMTTSPITIGSNYAGGIIFYVDGTGQHGLVCAPSDHGNFQCVSDTTNIVGTSTAFGTGQSNTSLILAGCSQRPIAASVCDDLVLNGYSDWYLPSLDELQLMYSNLHAQGIGGFSGSWYWSSSHPYIARAWCINFNNGYVYPNDPNDSFLVRAVRAF